MQDLTQREEFWSLIAGTLHLLTPIVNSEGARQTEIELLQEQFARLFSLIGNCENEHKAQITEVMTLYAEDPHINLR